MQLKYSSFALSLFLYCGVGKQVITAHATMGLHNIDFNALAEDLQHAMDKNGVPSRAQNKLLAKLAPMEHQIVTK